MRFMFALPLLGLAAACNVQNDDANDQVRIQYNEQKVEDAASDAAHTAKDVAAGIGNVAKSTGRAIKDEVGDIDVDIDVNRTKTEKAEEKK